MPRVFTDAAVLRVSHLPSMGIVFADQTDRGSVCASSTCASDAMNVSGSSGRLVDDVGDVVHMDTSTRDIGKDLELTRFETFERLHCFFW